MRSAFYLRGLSLLLLGGILLRPSVRAADPTPAPLLTAISWDTNARGAFVVSLCRDQQGRVWIGTEDRGLWRDDPAAPPEKQYTHFPTQDGVGNIAYALTCDTKGRIWAGTVNHGVCVYNGKVWKTYTAPYGPLGLRVFALATSPVDGDVWIATEAGLTRYSLSQDTWTEYTRADGLPGDAANALAFDPRGKLYIGTQCDGISIGSPADNYQSWRVVRGSAQIPNAASGQGLPSSLINCLLVARSGMVYAGTDTGLALSEDSGKTWRYTRGLDWREKEQFLWHGPPPAPADLKTPLLLEDYVSALAEDGSGALMVGHWRQSLEIRDPKTGARRFPGLKDAPLGSYVAALLSGSDQPALVGWRALPVMAAWQGSSPAARPVTGTATLPDMPSPANPPNLAQLNLLLKQIGATPPDPRETEPHVTALADDWLTQGDWLGRYGRYWACLAAWFHPIPADYLWGAGWEPVNYALTMGPNQSNNDRLRYWQQWRYTDNPCSLEMPTAYLHSRVLKGYTTWKVGRRETEVDDHGETYPDTLDGPHVYTTLTVPDGLFFLSLYDFNKDGQQFGDRDYRISVRVHSGLSLEDVSGFAAQPELAHGSIRDFWGGVWKRFLVRGPITLTIEINRNNSFDTILPGVMLDLVDQDPAPYFQTVGQWNTREAARDRKRTTLAAQWPQASQRFHPATSEAEAATRLFDALDEKRLTNSAWWSTEGRRYYAPLLRWYASVARQPEDGTRTRLFARLATCYYQVGQYGTWEDLQKTIGLTSARQIEKSLRWDGVTNSYSGLGNEIVTSYLAAHSEHKEGLAH